MLPFPPPPLLIQLGANIGEGRTLQFSLNVPANATAAEINTQLDKLRVVMDRQRYIIELPALRDQCAQMETALERKKEQLVNWDADMKASGVPKIEGERRRKAFEDDVGNFSYMLHELRNKVMAAEAVGEPK